MNLGLIPQLLKQSIMCLWGNAWQMRVNQLRSRSTGLGLDNVVKMDCLFKDINDLNVIP